MKGKKPHWGFIEERQFPKVQHWLTLTLFPISYSNYTVFQNKSGLTVIQQRSPVLKSCKVQFVQSLLSWIRNEGFQDVLILGSWVFFSFEQKKRFDYISIVSFGQNSELNHRNHWLCSSPFSIPVIDFCKEWTLEWGVIQKWSEFKSFIRWKSAFSNQSYWKIYCVLSTKTLWFFSLLFFQNSSFTSAFLSNAFNSNPHEAF